MSGLIAEEKFEFSLKKSIIILIGICIIGISIRLHYLDVNSLLSFDALFYFWYGIDLSIVHGFPIREFGENVVYNNGWPTVLGVLFSFLNSEQILDYMLAQKLLSIIISTLTVFPIYFLCKKFSNRTYSVLGAAIFVLEPRIIQNSLFGITEPLYIFLTAIALTLFISHDKKMNYLSFVIIGLTSIVRNEGIFLLFAFSIIFFIRYRKERLKILPKYLICFGIFIIVILPMSLVKIDTMGTDGIISRLIAEKDNLSIKIEKEETPSNLVSGSFITLVKFIAWTSIPIFIIFVPLGIFRILKGGIFERKTIIITYFAMLVPALYAYSIPASDLRYLFIVYPIYCILSALAIKFLVEKFHINKNVMVAIILSGIIIASIIFLENKIESEEKDNERMHVSTKMNIMLKDSTILAFSEDSKYLHEAGLLQLEKFPISKHEFNESVPTIIEIPNAVYDHIYEYIEFGKQLNVTHIVVNSDQENPDALLDVYVNESKFEYLEKIYDSEIEGLTYHVKVFKINYELFDSIVNKRE